MSAAPEVARPPDPAGAALRDPARRLDSYRRRRGITGAVERLVPDAGERIYFRVRSPDEPGGTRIVCVMSRPYEAGTLPFANSAALYRRLGVAAPAIREEAPDLGVIALEDLGDDLLQSVALADRRDTRRLYGEAVSIIVRIQRAGARLRETADAGRFRAFSNRLDAARFRRELRFFATHFLGGHAGARLPPAAARELDALLEALAAEAADGPEALCHRDFHSRNLIARPRRGEDAASRLGVIDHQDSLLGPRTYDLMSLVRDPYVARASGMPFDERELSARFGEAVGLSPGEPTAAECDLVALQRNLKALGTYGFQVSRRRNEVYRRFIAPTLVMVRENLDRHRDRRDRRRLAALLSNLVDLG